MSDKLLEVFLKAADQTMQDWIAEKRPDFDEKQIKESGANFVEYLHIAYRIAKRKAEADLLEKEKSDSLSVK